MPPITELRVLDHGYVRLISYTPQSMVALEAAIMAGDMERAKLLLTDHDLTAVNAARASYGAQKESLDEKDAKLIKFLADAEPVPHSSPFRHAHAVLELNAPLPVARQWWRHAIGAGTTEDGTPWSELSRRYVRGGVYYHMPDLWRSKPSNSKQGSGGPIKDIDQMYASDAFRAACDRSVEVYDYLTEKLNVAPEQARMCLPQGVYTSWRWSPSVQALSNFLVHRLAPDAQREIREYAEAVYTITKQYFPLALDALVTK